MIMPTLRRKLVVMIEVCIKQYREQFFIGLARSLDKNGVDLRVVYSDPSPVESSKRDNVDLPPPLGHKVSRAYFLGGRLVWQRLPYMMLRRADLVVMVQANGYLSNYPLILARAMGWRKLGFLGHGYNHKGRQDALRERVKRWFAVRVDWWFAYTDRIAQHLVRAGMAPERITVIQNAIDTRAFAEEVQQVSELKAASLRGTLGIGPEDPVALYCGSLYSEKRLPFLLHTADRIRSRLPAFHLVVIGGGPGSKWLVTATVTRRWIHYVGPRFGREKAGYFRISDVVLNPGLVGLGILDCFAAGRPIVTCDLSFHSPEIAYLNHEGNGLMCPFDVSTYADIVCDVLTNPDRLRRLQSGAHAAAGQFTLENMIAQMAEGILRFLDCKGASGMIDEVKKPLQPTNNR